MQYGSGDSAEPPPSSPASRAVEIFVERIIGEQLPHRDAIGMHEAADRAEGDGDHLRAAALLRVSR